MQTDILKSFGAAIRRMRLLNGISQETFADLCDLHRTYVSDIELGKRNVSLENIDRIANALGISISDLFKEVEKQNANVWRIW